MKKTTTPLVAKRIAIAVAAVCASLSLPAAANENKAMLDLMLKKGVITQKDYDEFMEANKDADENKAFKDSRIDQDVSRSIKFIQKRANDGNVKPSGFGFVSGDGKNEINLTGRLHVDTRIFRNSMIPDDQRLDPDASRSGDQMDFRRARIGFNGKLWNDFNYEMIWNAPGSPGGNIDTAWLNYSAFKESQFRVGRFKQPFNLEDYGTSSNNIDFIERSYVNQLNPAKRMGMMLHGIPKDGFSYGFSFFQQDDAVASAGRNFQFAGRVTSDVAKLTGLADRFIHVGLAGTSGSYEPGAASATSSIQDIRTEHRGMNAFTPTFNSTGGNSLRPEIDKNMYGIEVAYGLGALKVQAEIAEASLTGRNTNTSVAVVEGKIRTQYMAVVYNLTGEQWVDSYKDGAFSSVKIKSNFDPNSAGWGAWQVGLRLSSYDASGLQNPAGTAVLTNGSNKGNTTTFGLTWFINPNSRIMLNHSMTLFDVPFAYPSVTGANIGDRESVTTIRAQYNF